MVKLQRYFVKPEQMTLREVMLIGEDARHCVAVMRAKPGDRFIACNGQGRDVVAKIVTAEREAVQAEIVQEVTESAEMAWNVTVAQSLPKADKLETVIQKGTEAGAFAFQPFLSRRTVVRLDERKEQRRVERWRKIAKEAAEQSHRSMVPEIKEICDWQQLLAGFSAYNLVLLCHEDEGRAGTGLRRTLAAFRQSLATAASGAAPNILLIIGPEGGFAPEEAEAAVANGAKAVGLGQRILRTETAALYALACIAYESGELGGHEDA